MNQNSEKIRKREQRERQKRWRREKREKFQQDHPKLYDFIVKAEAVGLTVLLFGIPYALGYMSKHEDVKNEAELAGYLKAENDFSNEIGRPDIDYIDDEGKYHQDLHFGAYAVWPSREAYLDAERQRLNSLSEGYPR